MNSARIWIGVITISMLGSCGVEDEAEQVELGTVASALTSPHLAGISDTDFATASANFAAVEDVNDGVGPIFNDNACGTCHTLGGLGGAGLQIERRYGRMDLGLFNTLSSKGGTLRQLKTLGAWKTGCNVPLEVEPTDATIHNVGRLTTPLFGLGLVDAMPDSFFTTLANAEPSNVRGDVLNVKVLLPNPNDPTQSINSNRVGRFGWKGRIANLVQFAADAYVNEMGITTSHCFKGTLINSFANESKPNGVAVSTTCEDGIPGVDDHAAPGGVCPPSPTSVIQDDVLNFTKFMTFLPPPPVNTATGTITSVDTLPGRAVFDSVGCANCHTRTIFTTPAAPANGVPGNFQFRPYSDFLVHDMGSLGDQIGNDFDFPATIRKMRTAPLWGVRFRSLLLHDGRAANVTQAILAHDGQGADAKNAFNALSTTNKNNLVNFVLAL